MRAHEDRWTQWIPKDEYLVIRLDGRAFHSFTKGMSRPYSIAFMGSMDRVAVKLCEQIQGARFAYVQSDEISILVTSFGLKTQQWFGGSVRKTLSISAGLASSAMTLEWSASGEYGAGNPTLNSDGSPSTPHFDSRILTFREREDVFRYFFWRQSDAARNAIQMTAQHLYPHKALHGKDRYEQLRMIEAAGVDYEAHIPAGFRNGRVVEPEPQELTHTYIHKRTGEPETVVFTRNVWEASPAPWFDWDEMGFLNDMIPDNTKEAS